jgi:hypothetical protein
VSLDLALELSQLDHLWMVSPALAARSLPMVEATAEARMADLVVLGGINMDLVIRTPVIPRPGETVLGSGERANRQDAQNLDRQDAKSAKEP